MMNLKMVSQLSHVYTHQFPLTIFSCTCTYGDTEESKPIDIEKGRRNLQEVRYYKRWSLSVTITQHNLDPNINQQTQTEQGEQL